MYLGVCRLLKEGGSHICAGGRRTRAVNREAFNTLVVLSGAHYADVPYSLLGTVTLSAPGVLKMDCATCHRGVTAAENVLVAMRVG